MPVLNKEHNKKGKMKLKNKTAKRRAAVKFRFNKKPKYEIGWSYAFMHKGKKKCGRFFRKSRVTPKAVELFVYEQTDFGSFLELERPLKVPHAAVIHDPWAAVSSVPRKRPPACVLFKKQSVCDRRYRRSSGQAPYKGKKVRQVKLKF